MNHALPWRNRLAGLLNVVAEELLPATYGGSLFFLLFAGYFMLRPVRETMGITGGVENLQWLFSGTFVATLLALPLFGWLAARVPRRQILAWTYAFFIANLLAFAIGFIVKAESLWLARGFYIWLSVFNLLAISVAWSVVADIFASHQARRLFALMAAGASAGGLIGPLLGVLLVGQIGHAGLLILSATLLVGAVFAATQLRRWRDRQAPADTGSSSDASQARAPLGGSPFAGAYHVLRSPYLLAIAVFVLLLATVTTFLYFEQAKLVAETFPNRVDQTRVFGTLDVIVQSLAIVTQIFFTGRIAQRLGVGFLLTAVPLIVAIGFLALAAFPVFAALAVIMVIRRAGEYALVRPGREMLYTVVGPEVKYKAKNFIDTAVYRGADAISAWVKTVIDLISQQPALAAIIGAGIAVIWAMTGSFLARTYARLESSTTQKTTESTP